MRKLILPNLIALLLAAAGAGAATWNDFDRADFNVDGRSCTLVRPHTTADAVGRFPDVDLIPAIVMLGAGNRHKQPGATLHLKFTGTAAGVFVAAGPDAGVIEFRVDGGSTRTCDLFTRWSAKLHLLRAQVLAAGLTSDEHDLQISVVAAHNEKSKGNAVRIIHFLVNGAE